jgi:fructokinase
MRIGIDLGGTKIEGIALSSDGDELYRKRIATPSGQYQATLSAIAGLVAEIERHTGQQGSVGIGIPGTVSPATGLVKNANSTCLIGHPLDKDLAELLQRPVRCANDANCFTLSEATDGAAAGACTVFGVILGTGVGGGLVINGQVLHGNNAIAGEWGHNPLPWPNEAETHPEPCYCGRYGCIESWLSGPALERQYARLSGKAVPASEIWALAQNRIPLAQAVTENYLERLAKSLATVINILDPDVIVLGGGLSKQTTLYDQIPLRWGQYIFSDHVGTTLVPARYGDASGVRGAAWLWPQ